uniref:G_PROTEIN_RECEP_F1_2 domain-containing protein n=2 Tax=Panagrellus redivivus TaxID=6233 RepID=A0A7E4ZUW8_PANRE
MENLSKYFIFADSLALSVLFVVIIILNSFILYTMSIKKGNTRNSVRFCLIVHIIVWYVASFAGLALHLYVTVFWRLSNNYNSMVLFVLGAPAYSTLYSVFISRWFLTLECIFVINLWRNQRRYLKILCTFFCITVDLGMLALFIARFATSEREPNCWFISCVFERYSYAIAMNFINIIILSSFFCSLWSLYLFHKTRATHSANEQTSMQQIIRFTIILDLYFNVVPQVAAVVTHWLGIDFQTYVGPVYRVLFVSYGLIINLRFYVCLVRRPAKILIQHSQAKRGIRVTATLPIT